MKTLLEHRYIPRYRLPRLIGCILSAFFIALIFTALVVFIGTPFLLLTAEWIGTSF